MRFIVILPVLFSFLVASAQNFQTYRSGTQAFYERNDTLFTVYARDIQAGAGNDTIFTFPNPWRNSSDSGCDLKRKGDFFLGSKMIKKSYTDHWYVNRWGDTLRFHVDVQAPIGSSYILMETDSLRFRAVFENLSYEVDNPILGVIQNLITQRIEVENLNGTPLAHPFDGKRFGITQFFGFNTIFNIHNFPSDTQIYTLKGSSVPFIEVDVRGLYPNTIFDIRPGYERHFVENYSVAGQRVRQLKYSLLTVSRIDRNDSIILSHRRAFLVKDLIEKDSTFRIDTVMEKISLNSYKFLEASEGEASLFGIAVPLDSFFRISHEGLIFDSLPRFQEKIARVYQQKFPNLNCLKRAMDGDSMIFAENLGKVFWRHEAGDTAIELKLHYFQRGVQTWGHPIDFSQYNGVEEKVLKAQIGPNPFGSELRVAFSDEGAERTVVLRDIQGRVRYEKSGRGDFQIQSNSWPEGVYFLEIYEGSKSRVKILIKGQ